MNLSAAAFTFGPLLAASLSIAIAVPERFLLWSGIGLLALTVGILCLWIYRLKTQTTSTPTAEDLRGRLAQGATMWAMVGIVVLAITILAITGYHAASVPIQQETEAFREFIDSIRD